MRFILQIPELCLTDLFLSNFRPHINVQARRLEEFFLLMAVCNTVVVAKKPHRDRMNDVGQIELSGVDCSVHISHAVDDCEGESITTIISDRGPSPSMESGSVSMSSTTLIVPPDSTSTPHSTSILDQNTNATPKRPSNLSFFSGEMSYKIHFVILFMFFLCFHFSKQGDIQRGIDRRISRTSNDLFHQLTLLRRLLHQSRQPHL